MFVLLNRVMDTMFLLKARKYQMLLGVTFLPKVFRYSFCCEIYYRSHALLSCNIFFLFLFFSSLCKIIFKYEIRNLGGFQRKSDHDNKILKSFIHQASHNHLILIFDESSFCSSKGVLFPYC